MAKSFAVWVPGDAAMITIRRRDCGTPNCPAWNNSSMLGLFLSLGFPYRMIPSE